MEPLERAQRVQGPSAPSSQTCLLSTQSQRHTVSPYFLEESFFLWSSGFHQALWNPKAHVIQFREPASAEAATDEGRSPEVMMAASFTVQTLQRG